MKEQIKKILHKYAKDKVNLHSETAREIVATEILESFEGVQNDIKEALKISVEQINNPKGRRLDKEALLEEKLTEVLDKLKTKN